MFMNDKPPPETPLLVKNNKVVRYEERGLYRLLVEDCSLFEYVTKHLNAVGLKQHAPDLEWTGPKLPYAVFLQAAAFMLDCFDKKKDESMTRFWFNRETNEWATGPLPFYGNGLKVDEVAEHPLTEKYRKRWPEPWVSCGTMHTHAAAAAGQSGTDKKDEEASGDGFHITLGHMNKGILSCFCRFVIEGKSFTCHLGEMVEGPEWMSECPEDFHDTIIDAALLQPHLYPEDLCEYPKDWMDCCLEKKFESSPPTTHQNYPQYKHYPNQKTNTWTDGSGSVGASGKSGGVEILPKPYEKVHYGETVKLPVYPGFVLGKERELSVYPCSITGVYKDSASAHFYYANNYDAALVRDDILEKMHRVINEGDTYQTILHVGTYSLLREIHDWLLKDAEPPKNKYWDILDKLSTATTLSYWQLISAISAYRIVFENDTYGNTPKGVQDLFDEIDKAFEEMEEAHEKALYEKDMENLN
jgi:hypothetical protein